MNEFQIIQNYFQKQKPDEDVLLGIGDDAAIVKADAKSLAICVDTLVENTHFLKGTNAADIAYKAVVVNLSDLAAMGAKPKWITLALSLPSNDELWLEKFSEGLFQVCEEYNIKLIGGDLTAGPLTVTVQAIGKMESSAMLRSGAKAGDKIFLTGATGLAALGLHLLEGKIWLEKIAEKETLLQALHRPKAFINEGSSLKNFASSCIDVSDGLLADLNHILESSQVGAKVELDDIPRPNVSLDTNIALQAALTGGDDYQLCFTIPKENIEAFEGEFKQKNFPYFCIGEITAERKLEFTNAEKYQLNLKKLGYEHF